MSCVSSLGESVSQERCEGDQQFTILDCPPEECATWSYAEWSPVSLVEGIPLILISIIFREITRGVNLNHRYDSSKRTLMHKRKTVFRHTVMSTWTKIPNGAAHANVQTVFHVIVYFLR